MAGDGDEHPAFALLTCPEQLLRFAIFNATGEVVVASSELRFRSRAELTNSLISCGFTVEQIYGDWDRGPVVSTSRVMVIVAHRG